MREEGSKNLKRRGRVGGGRNMVREAADQDGKDGKSFDERFGRCAWLKIYSQRGAGGKSRLSRFGSDQGAWASVSHRPLPLSYHLEGAPQ
jgi:hypothetical protein